MVSTTVSAETALEAAAAVSAGAAAAAGLGAGVAAGVAVLVCPQANVAMRRPVERMEILITFRIAGRIAGATMASDGPSLVQRRRRDCAHHPESPGKAERAEPGVDRGAQRGA